MITVSKINLSATWYTWNFTVTHNRRLPSSGEEDVRRCVLFSIDLHGRFRFICKPGITMNGLDFSLKMKQINVP